MSVTTGYLWTKSLTVDVTKVNGGATLSNFPVLISHTDASLKTTANGGHVTSASGFDIIFTDATGTTQCNHELISYNATTGALVAWVQVPSVSSASNTIFAVYYGNSAITTTQEHITSTWDANYLGVYHLDTNPAGTAPQCVDSTTHASGTTSGMVSGDLVTGQIYKGLSFGTSKQVSVGTTNSVKNSTQVTISAWFKLASLSSGTKLDFYSESQNTGNTRFNFIVNTANKVELNGRDTDAGSLTTWVTHTTVLTTGGWHHAVGIYNSIADVHHIILDGSDISASLALGTIPNTTPSSTTYIAAHSAGGSEYFTGTMEELRLSNTMRTVGWAITEYNNQSAPGTFYSIGVETGLYSFTESISASDLQPGISRAPLDTLTISESFLTTGTVSTSDTLSSTDALFNINGFSSSESVTATESMSASEVTTTVENLSAVESLLITRSAILSDGGNLVESISAGEILTASESVPLGESFQGTTGTTFAENSVGSETFLNTVAYGATEALSATDILVIGKNAQSTDTLSPVDQVAVTSQLLAIETLAANDTFTLYSANVLLGEALTGTDTLIGAGGTPVIDVLGIADKFTATLSMGDTDSISITESTLFTTSLITSEAIGGNDTLLGSDAFNGAESYTGSDALTAIGIGAALLGGIETLASAESFVGNTTYIPIEGASASESITLSRMALFLDTVAPIEGISGSTTFLASEALTLSDGLRSTLTSLASESFGVTESLLRNAGYSASETLNLTESVLFTRGEVAAEALTVTESTTITTTLPATDSLSIVDSQQVVKAFSSSENLTIIDTFQASEMVAQGDALTASDTPLFSRGMVLVELPILTESVLLGGVYRPQESVILQESGSFAEYTASLDVLTVSDTALQTDTYRPLDLLGISDQFMGQQFVITAVITLQSARGTIGLTTERGISSNEGASGTITLQSARGTIELEVLI